MNLGMELAIWIQQGKPGAAMLGKCGEPSLASCLHSERPQGLGRMPVTRLVSLGLAVPQCRPLLNEACSLSWLLEGCGNHCCAARMNSSPRIGSESREQTLGETHCGLIAVVPWASYLTSLSQVSLLQIHWAI